MVPDSGESVIGIMGEGLASMVRDNARDGLLPASWEKADGPVPKDVPHPVKTFTDTLHVNRARLAKVGATYILTFEPGKEPDAFQRFADRAAARRWKVIRLEADHVPERSAPAALVKFLVQALL